MIPEGNRAGSTANAIFKATHYTSGYLNATGQTISSGSYLEQWTDRCPSEEAWGWDRDGDGCVDDADGDGVPDPFDRCLAGDDNLDLDQDNTPDACDDFVDSDADGVKDSDDRCQGHDDAVDQDKDGTPDGCDDLNDRDGDGTADSEDRCQGYDDTVDQDGDGTPDGCDDLLDGDGDGVADDQDVCEGDDTQDTDGDGVPDACDASPKGQPEDSENITEQVNASENTTNEVGDTATASMFDGAALPVAALLLFAVFGSGLWWLARRRE